MYGFSINGWYPNSWMVYFMENPMNVDDLELFPYFRKPPKMFTVSQKGVE
jgi:hypothetical protein